ncbi:conserved hypothetical protein [Paecilomyces variotii No. 5]|uniref:CmcJ-like methyltransferase n=1 Tax=Byssochlamys spectabilis (strain No. 5 / NBRC 109023) TaxID=1356009 RepID=V5GD30_BYSSN|nr:conserved hypothetical protein [Paecilomyces variotii No. 5]
MAATTCRRDISTELVYWDSVPVTIRDVRGRETEFTLDRNGFQYIHHEVPGLENCSGEDEIVALLFPETEKLVQKLTGATKTIVLTHRIRCMITDTAKRGDNRAPAFAAHSDFSVAGALHHLEKTIGNPAEKEQLMKGRFYIINVWRPLKTITRDPLAICDWKSVEPGRDWVSHRWIFDHGWNEFGSVVHNDKHKWFYLSHQEPSEPLVFTQFDSKETENGGVTLAHSAFVDPEYAKIAKARESIEIRMFAFVPEGDS